MPNISKPNEHQVEQTQPPIINDFCITFCTVNGSGSATANSTLLRSIFKMGVPVSGKNIFPSNIQGLPTWYSLRVSRDGFLGRVEKDDIVVAVNPTTIVKDLDYLVEGGVVFYADDISLPLTRDDLVYYPMPIKRLAKEANLPSNLRDYLANMVYVGVLAQILGIDLEKIKQSLDFHFKGKLSAVQMNFNLVATAANWAKDNLEKKDRYFIQPMDATKGYILADGNTAGAIGAIYGGVQFSAWYPITPASSLAESLNELVSELRIDPKTGKQTCAVVQAEDELAAIGMATGAGWAGLRSMTSTSGPGLSLMAEYLGLGYFAEIPVVVWDVQRVGPSTGLPTRTAQSDLTFANFISHGDTNFVILLPASVNECFEMGWRAFDIAERLQSPVLVLSDLDLGMNQWMTPKFEYPDQPMDRGKILWEDDLQKLLDRSGGKWGRYLDVDGDGITYRTVMGNKHKASAYFTRGTGHDEYAHYSEDADVWKHNLERIARKFETIKAYTPKPALSQMENATIGIISYGSSDPAVEESRVLLATHGIPTDYLRIKSLPFHSEVGDFLRTHERVYVIENNQVGQMMQLLTLNFCKEVTKLRKVAETTGLALSATWIYREISGMEA
ncbi:MAG TPA: 2-oxoacid:acceptor oxidoreductase subunit alpha [Anaerolineaceae bacterium]